jgi:signal transduction histidine kinase
MDFKNYLILSVALANIILGLLILVKGRESRVNKVYALLSFSVFYWCIGMIMYRASETIAGSLFWCKLLYAAPIFVVGSFLFFSYIFPDSDKKEKNIVRLIIIFTGAFMFFLTVFTDKIIEEVIFRPEKEKAIVFGSFYFLYIIFISGYFLWAYIKLVKRLFYFKGIVRAQILYVFWGSFLASGLGMITNLTLPTLGIFYFNWLGQVFSIVMVGFIAYAVIVHRLMDIKLVMRRYSVFTFSIASILILTTIVRYFINLRYLEENLLVDTVVLIVAILLYARVKEYYYKIANKYFFSSLYDAKQVIAEISDKLRSSIETKKIYKFIYETLDSAVHVKAFGILSFNEKNQNYYIEYNKGFNAGNKIKFSADKYFNAVFISRNESIVIEELKHSSLNKESKKTLNMLSKLKVEIITPLNVKDKTVGLLTLGPKESGDMYNEEDLSVLKTVGAQAAIAIENAFLFQETKNFNKKLKKEIRLATKELRQANEKLKKLDQAKSEFISIASHQLRTPLTVIKGYVSMMLEGSFGKILPEQKDSLKKVFQSSERLIHLIENLLNISRIESGRLQFSYEMMNFEELVENVIEELETTAKKKKLKLIYKKPKKTFPKVRIDREKIRQVIMNLIDNAIKYTEKGEVEIELKLIKNKIFFSVSDSGMGIEKGDMLNLFKKFSRGQGTSVIHTEGTGLGLYVARQMIENHKGKIWAESEGKGKGAKFIFELPILKRKSVK